MVPYHEVSHKLNHLKIDGRNSHWSACRNGKFALKLPFEFVCGLKEIRKWEQMKKSSIWWVKLLTPNQLNHFHPGIPLMSGKAKLSPVCHGSFWSSDKSWRLEMESQKWILRVHCKPSLLGFHPIWSTVYVLICHSSKAILQMPLPTII